MIITKVKINLRQDHFTSRSASRSASKSAANMFRFIMNGRKTIRKHKRKNSTKRKDNIKILEF